MVALVGGNYRVTIRAQHLALFDFLDEASGRAAHPLSNIEPLVPRVAVMELQSLGSRPIPAPRAPVLEFVPVEDAAIMHASLALAIRYARFTPPPESLVGVAVIELGARSNTATQ